MKKRLLIAIWSSSVVVIVAIILACMAVAAPRRNFDRFLKEVAKVEIGKTTLEDWRGLVARAQLSNLAVACQQQNCGFGLLAENKLLHKLRLAPPSVVNVGVGFKDGIASEIYIVLVIGGKNEKGEGYDEMGVVVRQSTDRPMACHPHYALSVKQRYGGFWATVKMDSCVSPDDRAKVLAINSACLTRIGGCKSLEDIIPQVLASR